MEGRKGAQLRERTFDFACRVLELHRLIYQQEPSLRGASFQVAGAATSIGANLEEANGAESRADFIHKCTIALKEARETHYWLKLLNRVLGGKDRIPPLVAEANELVAILTTIVKNTKARQ